ncbi:conjugal transfer protein [Streptomyces sp. NPDC059447]|uniref:conjugal transfer protein n=1 Tax=Streptomyces sp. NPDC059447 TaxID=3346834 RepID=UPI0036BE491B
MTPASPPRRRPAAETVTRSLRKQQPETVPAGRPVSRGPRFARLGLWAALAAGPLALAAVAAMPRTTVAQAAPTPHATEAGRPPADPRGVAELFVDLWLHADTTTPDSPAGAALRSLAPGVDLPKQPRGIDATPFRVVAVRMSDGADGASWTVMVAVLRDRKEQPSPTPSGPGAGVSPVRYFAVSGTRGPGGGSVAVVGAPAEVAAPDAPTPGAEEVTHRVPADSALGTTLGEFVRTYLGGGQGAGLDRYLSPGLSVAVPKAAPYARVEVDDVTADSEKAAGAGVPEDGTTARVRIRVTGQDSAGGRWPLLYRAEVTARAGRWEISQLEAGVTGPSTGTHPTPTTSTAAATLGGAR